MNFVLFLRLTFGLVLLLVLGIDSTPKDTCTRHGIFKLTDEFYVPEDVSIEVTLDFGDYFTFLDQIVDGGPLLIEKLKYYSDLKGITDDRSVRFIGDLIDKSVFAVQGALVNAHSVCTRNYGRLVNLDRPYYDDLLVEFMTKESIASIPLDVSASNKLDVISRNGAGIGAIPSTWNDTLSEDKIYYSFSENKVVPVTVGATTNITGTIFCMKNRNPFDIISDKDIPITRRWTFRVKKFIENLKQIIANIQVIKGSISRLPIFSKEKPKGDLIVSTPLRLIWLTEYVQVLTLKRKAFWTFDHSDMETLDDVIKFTDAYTDICR